MADPLNIILVILTAIFCIASVYYHKKYIEAEKCYKNQISSKRMPRTSKSKVVLERERYLKIRSKILLRDHFRCQECGYYKHLEVHHIVPRKKGGTDNPENLITLCTRCHRKVHGFQKRKAKPKRWKKHGYGGYHHRNRHKKKKRYFKQHKKEFIFENVPSKNWDDTPEEEKKKRRNEVYQLWVHNK